MKRAALALLAVLSTGCDDQVPTADPEAVRYLILQDNGPGETEFENRSTAVCAVMVRCDGETASVDLAGCESGQPCVSAAWLEGEPWQDHEGCDEDTAFDLGFGGSLLAEFDQSLSGCDFWVRTTYHRQKYSALTLSACTQPDLSGTACEVLTQVWGAGPGAFGGSWIP